MCGSKAEYKKRSSRIRNGNSKRTRNLPAKTKQAKLHKLLGKKRNRPRQTGSPVEDILRAKRTE